MTTALLVCIGTVGLASDTAVLLPAESVLLHRNGTAWIRRSGSVPVNAGVARLALDPALVAGSWNVEPALQTPRPSAIRRRSLQGRPVAELEFPAGTPAANLTTTALAARLGWRPVYRLEIGPESNAKLSLTAVIENRTGEAIAAKSADCSLALPSPALLGQTETAEPASAASAAPAASGRALAALQDGSRPNGPSALNRSVNSDRSANDATLFALGPLTMSDGSQLDRGVLEQSVRVEEELEWEVAGPQRVAAKNVLPDVAETVLRLVPSDARSLPPGPVLIQEGGRLRATAELPYVFHGEPAQLRLGPAPGITVTREETELERKQTATRRENEESDWIRMTGSLTIKNARLQAARLRIRKAFEGEGIAASDEGKIQRRPNQVGRDRPLCEIRWTVVVLPGQTKRLTYGYQLQLTAPLDREPAPDR